MSRQPHVRQFSLRWRLNAPRIETGQSWFRAARPAETLRPLQQVFEILRARRQWGNAVYFSRLTRRSRLPVAKLRQLPGRRRARPRPPFAALRSKLRKERRNRPNDGRFPAGLRPTKFGHARQSPSAWKPRLSVIAGMSVLGVSACDALLLFEVDITGPDAGSPPIALATSCQDGSINAISTKSVRDGRREGECVGSSDLSKCSSHASFRLAHHVNPASLSNSTPCAQSPGGNQRLPPPKTRKRRRLATKHFRLTSQGRDRV